MKKPIFTIDVEEWYHILETGIDTEKYKSTITVDYSLKMLLDVLDESGSKATLFFLGEIAKNHPELVEFAAERGHEIASHGYGHELIAAQNYEEFFEDIYSTKSILEDISGKKVSGYRAPGFSLTPDTIWAYEAVAEAGYTYSSSVFPAKRAHGGFPGFNFKPTLIETGEGELIEFPVSSLQGSMAALNCFGGGYFRLFPHFWYSIASKIVLKKTGNLVFYIHPRDINPKQPHLDLPPLRRLKSYINIDTALGKVSKMLAERPYGSFEEELLEIRLEQLPKFEVPPLRKFKKVYTRELAGLSDIA